MSPKPMVLIVEDDSSIAAGLSLNLQIEGYDSQVARDGQAGIDSILAGAPDLVLLDITLPVKNGLEVLREIREAGQRVPVIVLSARQDEFDKVAALRLGADDYVTKPFALAELMARVVAVLRRSTQPWPSRPPSPPVAEPAEAVEPASEAPGDRRVFQFADVSLDLDTRTANRDGQDVKLTHLEFELLSYLVQHPARVFTREQLQQNVWGYSGSPRTVDNFVGQLRAKLERDPDRPRHLVTVRGSGYRFDP